MGRQVVEVQADSTASPEQVWRLLADVTTWPQWTRFAETGYEREGTPAPHGLGAIRRLRVGRMRSREEVLAFDPPRHFAYDYVGSLPFRTYRGDVTLAPHDGGTRITWHSEFEPKHPLTGPLLKVFMSGVLRDIVKRLAAAAAAP